MSVAKVSEAFCWYILHECMWMRVFIWAKYWNSLWTQPVLVFVGSNRLCSCWSHPDHVAGEKTHTHTRTKSLILSKMFPIMLHSLTKSCANSSIQLHPVRPWHQTLNRGQRWSCRPENTGGSVCLVRTAHSKSQQVICSFCHLINGPGAKDKPLSSS